MLASGAYYFRKLGEQGLCPDTIASQTTVVTSLGGQFFMEIAKLRAARMLWARMGEAFGVSEEQRALRLHGRTTLWNKTRHDPYANLLRTTTEALGGAIGGVQSMHVAPFDECLRVPDTFSRRIARNTQIILQEECELTGVIDPAGGSWYIEQLTLELAEAAWKQFQMIEAEGGIDQSLLSGQLQIKIEATREARLKQIGSRRQGLIGTNLFPNLEETPLKPNTPNWGQLKQERSKSLNAQRTSNGEAADFRIMEQLNQLASGESDLQAMIEAALAGASLGELQACLKAQTNSEPVNIQPLPVHRAAMPFEALRAASSAYKTAKGHGPKLYLATVGALKAHKARMDFTSGFFQTGGFEITAAEGTTDPQAAAQAFLASGSDLCVICGSDPDYVEFVPAFCQAVKANKPGATLILAGAAGEHEAAYKEAGLDDSISIKSPNHATNARYLEQLGVL